MLSVVHGKLSTSFSRRGTRVVRRVGRWATPRGVGLFSSEMKGPEQADDGESNRLFRPRVATAEAHLPYRVDGFAARSVLNLSATCWWLAVTPEDDPRLGSAGGLRRGRPARQVIHRATRRVVRCTPTLAA